MLEIRGWRLVEIKDQGADSSDLVVLIVQSLYANFIKIWGLSLILRFGKKPGY